MSETRKPDKSVSPVSFATANKRLGSKDRVKLNRNTYLERRGDKRIAVLYHATDIVTYTPMWIELDSGGWHTMSTAGRMRDYIPGDIRAEKSGWHWYPLADDLDCYCLTRNREQSDGIVVIGEWQPGYDLHFTERYEGESEHNPNGKPVYVWNTCKTCLGTAKRTGVDWGSGGFVYFDGMRIHPSGRRIMRTQPHKPASVVPVTTRSGWTGRTRGRQF